MPAQSLLNWFGLQSGSLSFALRLTLSSWLSFAVAVLLNIENPYWAAIPVWVVAQSSRGVLLERAAYRFIGTLIGAAFGFALMHTVAYGWTQVVLLALWIAGCAWMTQFIRGVLGYSALLGGITAAIVVIPSGENVELSTTLALSRVYCTLIGVVVTSIVMGLTTPSAPRRDHYRDLQTLAAETLRYGLQRLSGELPNQTEAQLLRRLGELARQARLVSAGSRSGYQHLSALEALGAAIMQLIYNVEAQGSLALSEKTQARWLALISTIEEGSLENKRRAWPVTGVQALDAALRDLAVASASLHRSQVPLGLSLQQPKTLGGDVRMAWYAAAVAGSTCGIAIALAHGFDNHSVKLGAVGVCIFALILGSLSIPRRLAIFVAQGVIVGVLVALFYRTFVQPYAQTIPSLLLTLLPFIFMGGLCRASSRFGLPAVDANMCFMLATQAGLPVAHTDHMYTDCLALGFGAVSVAMVYRLVPTATKPKRLIKNWASDVQRLLVASYLPSPLQWQLSAQEGLLQLQAYDAFEGDQAIPDGQSAMWLLGDSILALRMAAQAGIDESLCYQALQQLHHGFTNVTETQASLRQLAEQAEPETADLLQRTAHYLGASESLWVYAAV